jgi:hypothetical protein
MSLQKVVLTCEIPLGKRGKVIDKLTYGTKLDWSPPGSKDIKSFVVDNGEELEGYWVKASRSLPTEIYKGIQVVMFLVLY